MLKGVDDEKKQKHDALMDEFKKAHRKMFANNNNNDNNDNTSSTYTPEKINEEKFVKEPDNDKFNYSAVLGVSYNGFSYLYYFRILGLRIFKFL